MSLAMTTEQESMRETARRFLAVASPPERVREVMATATAFDAELWTRLARELGLPGLTVPEELGGIGLGFQELSYFAEECGRVLAPSPLLSTLGLAVPVLLASGDARAQSALLPGIVAGETLVTVGWLAPGSAWDATRSGAEATRTDEGWEVSGNLTLVLDGAIAHVLLVLAETDLGPTL